MGKHRNERMIEPKKKIKNLRRTKFYTIYYIFAIALIFCLLSFFVYDWLQNLLLGLTTGFFTSALISIVMLFYQRKNEQIQAYQDRIAFMEEFKIVCYNLLNNDLDMAKEANIQINLEEYVKKQHRWFHDYYKYMVANNEDEEQTKIRIAQLKNFYQKTAYCKSFIEHCKIYKLAYTDWQLKEFKCLM